MNTTEDRKQQPFVAQVAARHGADLVRYLSRRLRVRADARDLAQEVYLRLLRLNDVSLVRNPQVYVFRIASNLLHEFALKSPASLDADSLGLEEPMTDAAALENAADRRIQARRINRALDELSPRCRAVFILHRRDEMTYEEIARHVGISMSMVKKYLGIALKHCRQRLRDLDP